MEKLVIYHGNCVDGFGAAYAAWKKFGDDAEYVPMSHGDSVPYVDNRDVFILDFSFPLEVYDEICKKAKSVKLLDHHATAYQSLCNCKGCYFDLNKSGATITWEKLHNEPMPSFLTLIEDGDLYKFEKEETKYFYKSIMMYPRSFKDWEMLEDEKALNKLINDGKQLHQFWNSLLDEVEQSAEVCYLGGLEGSIVNANGMFASDIGNRLYTKNGTFALIWREEKGKIKCSLRSHNNYDVSQIAKKYGGGGHPQACAFKLNSLAELQKMLKKEKELYFLKTNKKTNKF